jgi:molybdopterin-guanine dinucleotide biosynthesis protein B
MTAFHKPVLGFAAFSGTGKTTLLKQVIPLLRAQGLRLALIKHSHHDFDIDTPGKDSYELRKAGAQQVLIASAYREALVTEREGGNEPQLDVLLQKLDPDMIDLVLVEGFRHVAFPKIELHRTQLAREFLYTNDSSIIAVATDSPLEIARLPVLDINKPEAIVHYIKHWLNNRS